MPAGPLLYGSYKTGSPEWWAQRALLNSYARHFFADAFVAAFALDRFHPQWRMPAEIRFAVMDDALRMAGLPV